ncbi:HsmA family protein [Tessaracoccus sp. OH4464_COT-324]|uniref:HsmA family protein n=1 Tax=Tessaracoccus sp. OH4464_COT-324 TaxID=2491059 RepID=UPI000F62D615|nr:HsmA family protein [Tessaracoccus sp. OH4464_COT-324]RRD47082.1 TIGR03987 family protein [Tessaracoccus sp. OH4464_COT-324]
MLALSIVLISLALASYTVGVLAEHRGRVLRWWHAAAFAVGLLFDATGTWIMSDIARSGAETLGTSAVAQGLSEVMAITGAAALLLMALHLAWALTVLWRGREREKAVFHRFSLGVWLVWLVPYFTGMSAAVIN